MHKTCLSLFLALDTSMKLDSAQAAHCSLVSTRYPDMNLIIAQLKLDMRACDAFFHKFNQLSSMVVGT